MAVLVNDPIFIDARLVPSLTHREIWEWYVRKNLRDQAEDRREPPSSLDERILETARAFGADPNVIADAIRETEEKRK